MRFIFANIHALFCKKINKSQRHFKGKLSNREVGEKKPHIHTNQPEKASQLSWQQATNAFQTPCGALIATLPIVHLDTLPNANPLL